MGGACDALLIAFRNMPEDQITTQRLILVGHSLIIPAYSQVARYYTQLANRLSAAFAGADMPGITHNEVTTVLLNMNQNVLLSSAQVDDMLVKIICVDNDGIWDMERSVMNIGDTRVLQERFGLSAPITSLLNQLRLIYLQYHSASLNISVAVLNTLHDKIVGLGAVFEGEFRRLDEQSQHIIDHPLAASQWF